jgi:hypothetical protein
LKGVIESLLEDAENGFPVSLDARWIQPMSFIGKYSIQFVFMTAAWKPRLKSMMTVNVCSNSKVSAL